MSCPSCGAIVQASASRCPSCAATLDAVTHIAAPAHADTPPGDQITTASDAAAFAAPSQRASTDAATITADTLHLTGDAPPGDGDAPTIAPHGIETAGDAPTRMADADTIAAIKKARVPTGPLEEGQAFGARYHIIRALGAGGMGAVYQAWDAELGVAVAIKVIRPDALADPVAAAEIQRRFKRELLLARQVTHKNVVRIHDLGEIDGIKYITMTYVEGADLATLLRREGRLPIPTVMRIARDVVAGLLAAHKAGVVHRDLKPANIAIDQSGDALIMDFGIARSSGRAPVAAITAPAGMRLAPAAADATRLGAIVGTVEYMAPEQARGAEVDHRADIYALGLMLYDMLVGRERRAQRAESAIAELQARMEQPPPPAKSILPEIPEDLDTLLSRCLEPDPAKRYQTTEELAAELGRLDDTGKRIPIPRRITARMMAAAAVVVIALVSGTWWFTRTPPPEKPHDPVSIVIADFQNATNDSTFDETLAQTARRALEGASFISAYDRTNMRSIGVRPPATLDEKAAREIARKQGFGVVLAGSIQRKGDRYDIAVTASQTFTGSVINTASASASSKDQVLPTATRLMARVRKALGDTTPQSAQLFAMRSLTASSPDAVKYYAAAVEAQAQAKVEEARQNYLKAVELDPNFGLAYQGLAVTSWNLGRPQEADAYIQQALRHLDSMTDRERFATRGYYDKLIGDNAQCVKEYGDLLARYPADATAHNGRAACFYNLRDMKSAVEELSQAVKMLPNHAGFKTNLALLTALAGEFDTAEQEARALPPNPFTLQVLAYSQIGRGQLAQATDTYQEMAATGPTGASAAATGFGDLAIYEGRFSDAVRLLEQGAAVDVASKNANKAAIKLTAAAYARLMSGHRAQAVAAADKALAASTSMAVRFLAGRVYAEAGALEKARLQSASLLAELPAQPHAYGRIIEGLVALNDNKPRDAVRILNDANGMLDTWFGRFDLGRAYLAAGAFPQADAEFDRAISRRGEALTLMDEGPTFGYFPPVYYYQGRVRQALNTASFADGFRKYLDIRGKSTEDALVADARKRAGA